MYAKYSPDPRTRFGPARSRLACLLLGVASLVFASAPARAQLPPPQVDPADLGLRVPQGPPVKEGGDRRVVTKDDDGNPVVAQVFLSVGDTYIVQMPDNRLRSVRRQEATETDRPFEPYSQAELRKKLEERFPGFQTGATKRYVYVYNTSKPFFEATSRILETMYPALVAYCRRQRLPVHEPDTPLVVIMFRTQQEYQQYREMPPEVVAYYNTVSNCVVMYEQSSLTQIAPAIAVRQSISTIAHEGVHQILHSIGVQQRLSEWPAWISEGVPEFFSPTSTDKRVRWAGVGKPNPMRMHSLKTHLQADPSVLRNGDFLRKTVASKQLTVTGYAMAWALTDYLAKNKREEFFAYLREVSAAKPLDDPPDSTALFEKHFGGDYEKLQTLVLKHLAKLPYVDPILNQPHYVAVIDLAGVRRVMVTSSPAAVQQWQAEVLNGAPAPARRTARMNVRIFANRGLAQQAARSALD